MFFFFRAQKRSQLYAKVITRFGFLVFYFHADREITENLFTVTENVLQKKTFVHLLGLQRNVIAGTKRAILSGQYRSILPAHEACHIIIYIIISSSSSIESIPYYYMASSMSGQDEPNPML